MTRPISLSRNFAPALLACILALAAGGCSGRVLDLGDEIRGSAEETSSSFALSSFSVDRLSVRTGTEVAGAPGTLADLVAGSAPLSDLLPSLASFSPPAAGFAPAGQLFTRLGFDVSPYAAAGRRSPIVACGDGKVCFFGGVSVSASRHGDVWELDLATRAWTRKFADTASGDANANVLFPRIRHYHSTAAIGRALYVFGGRDGSGTTRNDVWKFDLDAETWTLLEDQNNGGAGAEGVDYPQARVNSALAVWDGHLYVIGGASSGGARRNDVWRYDLTANAWTRILADDNGGTGTVGVDYPRARESAALVAIGNLLYLFGGYDAASTYHNDVWSFDPTFVRWTRVRADNNGGVGYADTHYPKRRRDAGVVALSSSFYVFGGMDSAGGYRNDLYAFKPDTATWTRLIAVDGGGSGTAESDYPLARDAPSVVAAEGKLYALGGCGPDETAAPVCRTDLWETSIANPRWRRLRADDAAIGGKRGTDFPLGRSGHGEATSADTYFLFGGRGASGNLLNDVWSYAPTTGAWTRLFALDGAGVGTADVDFPERRKDVRLAAIGDSLYVFAGTTAGGTRSDLWRFDLATREWELLIAHANGGAGVVDVDFPRTREMGGLAAIGAKLYVFGGHDATFTPLNDVWEIDTAAPAWVRRFAIGGGGVGTAGVDFPAGRTYAAMGAIGGALYVVGGFDDAFALRNDVWRYDPATGWTRPLGDDNEGVGVAEVDFPDTITSATAAVCGDRLVLFGGYDGGYSITNRVWAYDAGDGAWTRIAGADQDGIGTAQIHHPVGAMEGGSGAATCIGSHFYFFGGTNGSTTGDFWSIDLDARAAGRARYALVQLDLAVSSGTLPASASFAFGAAASGEMGGVDTAGVKVFVWNADAAAFEEIAANSAANAAAGTFAADLDLDYRDDDDRLTLLIKADHATGASFGSRLDLDFSALSMPVEVTP